MARAYRLVDTDITADEPPDVRGEVARAETKYETRVLVLEDQVDVRTLICRTLRDASLNVVWADSTLEGALNYLEHAQSQVDVALVDLGLPDACGVEAVRSIAARHAHLNILVLTLFDDGPTVLAALAAGARGYLAKHVERSVLTNAVRAAARGESPMSPHVARFLVEAWSQRESSQPVDSLTSRERRVLELLARGEPYAGVATQLEIGLSTVQSYIKSIYGKLGVNSKNEATSLARRRGLIA